MSKPVEVVVVVVFVKKKLGPTNFDPKVVHVQSVGFKKIIGSKN